MASEGYPGDYEKGRPIRGLAEAESLADVKVFHAGTRQLGGQVVTDGGRVLGITALGNSIASAKLQAYKAVKCIRWDGAWCRRLWTRPVAIRNPGSPSFAPDAQDDPAGLVVDRASTPDLFNSVLRTGQRSSP